MEKKTRLLMGRRYESLLQPENLQKAIQEVIKQTPRPLQKGSKKFEALLASALSEQSLIIDYFTLRQVLACLPAKMKFAHLYAGKFCNVCYFTRMSCSGFKVTPRALLGCYSSIWKILKKAGLRPVLRKNKFLKCYWSNLIRDYELEIAIPVQ